MKRLPIEFIPLGRDCLGDFQKQLCVDFGFKNVQPRFKGLETSHLLVDYFAVVQIPSRLIREIPLSAIEAEALIDHPPLVRSADFLAAKDHLPRVGVACPQVEDEHSNEILEVACTQ